MSQQLNVSPEVKASTQEYLQKHPEAKVIYEVEQELHSKKMEVIDLEAKLTALQKKRPKITIEYRKSVLWCLTVDSDNPSYFLKNKEGLVKCIEYKHKVKITPQQNNAIGSILSGMFRDGLIGRIKNDNHGVFFYGIIKFFDKDKEGQYSVLKKKYEKQLDNIITVE